MLEAKDVALVTGASRGIGLAIALALGRAGATVVGTATTAESAARLTEQLAAAQITGQGMVWQAEQASATEALIAQLGAGPGLPNILINNAGIARDALILRMKPEEWEQTLAVNLTSVFRLTKASLKRMLKERYGRIVNVGSVVGSIGNAGQVHYAAAKAGLVGFSRALAKEVATRNITVNIVSPGFIETDMTRALPQAARDAYLAQIPIGKFGTAEDVAQMVLFLCSREAAYMTGQTLHVNGGMYMG
jgi:3-oxoacyl-[acyl-carrier protein] reductase